MMDFRNTNYSDAMREARDHWNSDAPSGSFGFPFRISPSLIGAFVIALPLIFIGWQLYVANNPAPHEPSSMEILNNLRESQGLKPL